MKKTLKPLLLLLLTAMACSKYDNESNCEHVAGQHLKNYDTITYINSPEIVKDSTAKIVIKNNIYRSVITAEG